MGGSTVAVAATAAEMVKINMVIYMHRAQAISLLVRYLVKTYTRRLKQQRFKTSRVESLNS